MTKLLFIRNQYGLGMVLIIGIIPGHLGVTREVVIMEADTEEVEDIGDQVEDLGVVQVEEVIEVVLVEVVVADLVEVVEEVEVVVADLVVVVEVAVVADAKYFLRTFC
jgi:hypothetical protein